MITATVGIMITATVGIMITATVGIMITATVGIMITATVGIMITATVGIMITATVGIMITATVGIMITATVGIMITATVACATCTDFRVQYFVFNFRLQMFLSSEKLINIKALMLWELLDPNHGYLRLKAGVELPGDEHHTHQHEM